MKIIKFIAAVIPGPIVVWLSQWFDLFRETIFVHPSWADIAERSSIAAAAVVCTVCALIFFKTGQEKLKSYAIYSIVGAIILLVACAGFNVYLSRPLDREVVELSYNFWRMAYIFMLCIAALSLTFSTLYYQKAGS